MPWYCTNRSSRIHSQKPRTFPAIILGLCCQAGALLQCNDPRRVLSTHCLSHTFLRTDARAHACRMWAENQIIEATAMRYKLNLYIYSETDLSGNGVNPTTVTVWPSAHARSHTHMHTHIHAHTQRHEPVNVQTQQVLGATARAHLAYYNTDPNFYHYRVAKPLGG